MMETVDLSPKESADQLQGLYEGLVDVVAATLKNGDNPGVRVRPYAHGVSGRTHWTIGIDGLLTGPNMDFVTALNALPFFAMKRDPTDNLLGSKCIYPSQRHDKCPLLEEEEEEEEKGLRNVDMIRVFIRILLLLLLPLNG